MASADRVPLGSHWSWSEDERLRLRRRFQRGLYSVLKAVGALKAGPSGDNQATVKALADRIESAGLELDVCAANCHAMATTLRAQAGLDTSTPGPAAQAGVRLRKALGSPVVLTHTTIEHLAGKVLRLEYIEGANAIVQANGEYWGTPLDRILVLQDAVNGDPATSLDPGADPASAAEPAFVFALRQGELSNAIQFVAMTARPGVLTVTPRDHAAVGRVTLESRRVTRAEFGAYRDIEAVARLMLVPEASAVFHDVPPRGDATVQLSTDQLLIEAAVMADELVQ